MPLLKKKVKFILVIFLIIFIAYFGISVYIAYTLTLIAPKELLINKEEVAQGGEDIEILTRDNIKLSGWFFPADSEEAIILVHGIEEIRTNEYSNGVELIKYLISEDYNVLAYDTRGNGQSETSRVSFGQNEGKDIEGAIRLLEEKGFENSNIGIIANSMGAIALLQNIENINAGAIIVESPASAIEPIIRRELTQTENIPEFIIPGVYLSAKLFFGLDIYSIRPIDKVSAQDKLLIFHGEADYFIPIENSQMILDKSHPENRLVIFEDSEHVESFKDHPEQYLNEVLRYFEEKLQ